MTGRIDVLDQRDPLALPLFGSLLFHSGIVGALVFGFVWMNRHSEKLGDLNPAGGAAYTVSSVHNIPIPQRQATPNPVANDTQSTVPTAPAKQQVEKKEPLPSKNQIEIPDRFKRQAEKPATKQQFQQPTPQNQIFSHTKQALSNPMYNAPSGAGQVGVGPNTPLGNNRLGWYAELIRQKIAQSWNTNGLDSRSQNTPAIVSFYIMRDGTIRTPSIAQSSGNPTIDNTALRAVYQASPMPALPPQITESYISAQFTFNLR